MTRRPRRSKNSRLRDAPVAAGVAFLRVHEHEVDVRRDVELAAAELAHAHDDQRLLLPRFLGGGRTVNIDEGPGMQRSGRLDRQLGQRRHRGTHFVERRLAVQVARHRMQDDPLAQAPQLAGQQLRIIDGREDLPYR